MRDVPNPPNPEVEHESDKGASVDFDFDPDSLPGKVVVEPRTLYVVSTPIGNLSDLTARALGVLRAVDVIYAEDTRVAHRLLSFFPRSSSSTSTSKSTSAPKLTIVSCHRHNMAARLPAVLATLARDGRSAAYVSDAGTPCVSDPGAELVSAVAEYNRGASATQRVTVRPVPGACAAIAALSVSGFAGPGSSFTFLGFLPSRSADTVLRALPARTAAVLYEAPHRVVDTLRVIHAQLPARPVCLARELTKKFEQVLHFDSAEHAAQHLETHQHPRGEFTIVLGPTPAPAQLDGDAAQAIPEDALFEHLAQRNDSSAPDIDVKAVVDGLVKEGLAVSAIAKIIARASNIPKKAVYSYASSVRQAQASDDPKS